MSQNAWLRGEWVIIAFTPDKVAFSRIIQPLSNLFLTLNTTAQ